MKLSRTQAAKRLKQIDAEAKELSKDVTEKGSRLRKLKGSISQKQDQADVDSIRKKLISL